MKKEYRIAVAGTGYVGLSIATLRRNTLLVSWYESIYHKVSVEAK